MPKADVNGAVSSCIECAAAPAKRARPASVVKPRVAWRTDGVPTRAKRARVKGSRGTLRMGLST